MTDKPQVMWQWWPLEKVKPYEKNAKIHSQGQIKEIANSIGQFGWRHPIMVDADGVIIAGHGRRAAAEFRNDEVVPVVVVTDLSAEKVRLLRLADNKIAENSSWDKELLAVEFADLSELNVDLAGLGWDETEIDKLIGTVLDSDDLVPLETDGDASRSGASVVTLSYGKQKVPLTDDEHRDLDRLLHEHIAATGSKFGFARSLIEARNAAPRV